MSRIGNAARNIGKLDELARRDTWLNRIHPLPKLLVTVLYLVLVVSFSPRQLTGVLGMAIYPFILFEFGDLSFTSALYRMRIILPVVCLVGVLNPIFDREPALTIFGVTVTGGVLTMLSLMVKGVLTVLATYLLIATTTVESVCGALRMLHIPGILVTEFLLICRYVSVLLSEADRMWQAYSMRAPGQRGVAAGAWGSMIGRLLLRSMDRAKALYQSMCLRGFRENSPLLPVKGLESKDLFYFASFTAALILLRIFPVLELVGRLFV